MKRTYALMIGSILVAQMAFSQKQTTTVQQLWFAYNNQTRFSDKWGMWADIHLRTKDNFTDDLSSFIARFGLTYYLNDQTKLTAGYAFINHFPADNHADISRPEHRPWQQIQWHTNYKKVRLMQWLRLEERFRRKVLSNDELDEGYNFNYRARYNIFLTGPLGKKAFTKGAFSWVLNDELHINFGDEIVYNYFDQNRFFAGFGYHLNPHNSIQVGYLNVFQQLAAGNRYRSTHAARIFYFHNIDLRRK